MQKWTCGYLALLLPVFLWQSCGLLPEERPQTFDPNAEIHARFFKPYLSQDFRNVTGQPSRCASCELMKQVPAHKLPLGDAINSSDGYAFYPQILVEFPRYWMDSTEITWGDVRKWLGADTLMLKSFKLFSETEALRGQNADRRPFLGNWNHFALIANRRSRFHGLDSVYQYQVVLNSLGQMDTLLNLAITPAAGFRLPSFAQWQGGCRAGKSWRFPWGNDSSVWREYANLSPGDRSGTLPDFILPAATLKPNSLGLHDMVGNASEWMEDLNYGALLRKYTHPIPQPGPDTAIYFNPKAYDTVPAANGSTRHAFAGLDAFDKVQWSDCYYENTRYSMEQYSGARLVFEDP